LQAGEAAIPDMVMPVTGSRAAPEWVSEDIVMANGRVQRSLFAPEDIRTLAFNLEGGRMVRGQALATSIGGVCIGARSPRHPDRPTVGRRILVFTGWKSLPPGAIISPADEEIFFEREDGAVSLPYRFGERMLPNGQALGLDPIIEQVE